MKKKSVPVVCLLLNVIIVSAVVYGAHNSHPVYRQLRNIGLSGQSVPVQNLVLNRDAAVFTFEEGTFYFLEPIENQCTGAVFIGKGEFTMTPVPATEKNHLKHLTGSPSITEKFSKMVLRFTDDTYNQIIASGGTPGENPGRGKATGYFERHRKLMRKGKNFLRPNIAQLLLKTNLDLRMLQAVTWPGQGGFFHSFFNGKKYGDILFTIDPLGAPFISPEEVMMACLGDKNLGIWVGEHRKEYYTQGAGTDIDHRLIDMEHYDIDAATWKEQLEVTVTARFKALVDGAVVIPFDLFPRLRVESVTDAENNPLKFIQEKYKEDADFAVILPEGLKKGKDYALTFKYSGKEAVIDIGGGNFTLVARSNWYPNPNFGDRATFGITVRTPAKMDVVATGQPVDRQIKDKTLISRWRCDIPIKVAGFNYGKFKKSVVNDEKLNMTIESYANKEMSHDMEVLSNYIVGNLDTARLMDKVRAEAHVGLGVYRSMFGPMVFDRVAITQQPFPTFGQAWPMLVYMPVVAYISSTQMAQMGLASMLDFVKYVCAHEVGHQWWAHTVGEKSYRSQWLGEALSQLSASLFVEVVYKRTKFLEFWKDLRKQALKKNSARRCPSRIGSITLGYRLDTAQTGNVSNAAFYAKGAFVAHMLRMMMWDPRTRDQRFSAMLKDFVKTYFNMDASTEDFKRMVEKHMTKDMDVDGNKKMDWFFDQWVHGTQIPHYEIDYDVEPSEDGKFILSCTITQGEVDDSFKMLVPIYVLFEGNRLFRLGSVVMKGNGSSQPIRVKLAQKPKRVFLCALEDVLCTIKGRK